MRLSVIVIPRFDAESRTLQESQLKQVAFTGFRVGARNDNYRGLDFRQMKNKMRLNRQWQYSSLFSGGQRLFSKRPPFTLQKVAFYSIKDGLSLRERPSFAKPPVAGGFAVWHKAHAAPAQGTTPKGARPPENGGPAIRRSPSF